MDIDNIDTTFASRQYVQYCFGAIIFLQIKKVHFLDIFWPEMVKYAYFEFGEDPSRPKIEE